MPNLKLTTLATYRAYFETIAEDHIAIDGYKWGDKDVIRNDSRSDMPPRLLWAMPYERATYEDNGSDNICKIKVARVAYMVVPESELFADEDAAFDACEAVIEEILARILVDKHGAEVDGEWTMIATRVQNWSTGPVEYKIGSTKYIGWEMNLTFIDNTNLAYDASKWN